MNSMKYKILSLLLLFVMSFVSTYLQAAVTQKGVGFSNLKSGCNNQNRPRERGVHEETFEKAKPSLEKFISTKMMQEILMKTISLLLSII